MCPPGWFISYFLKNSRLCGRKLSYLDFSSGSSSGGYIKRIINPKLKPGQAADVISVMDKSRNSAHLELDFFNRLPIGRQACLSAGRQGKAARVFLRAPCES